MICGEHILSCFFELLFVRIFNKISTRAGISLEELQEEFRLRSQLLYKMYQNKIFDFQQFQDFITQYYKRPQEVLQKFGVQ